MTGQDYARYCADMLNGTVKNALVIAQMGGDIAAQEAITMRAIKNALSGLANFEDARLLMAELTTK